MKAAALTGLLLVIILGGLVTFTTSNQLIIDVPVQTLPDEVRYVPDEFIVVLAEGADTPSPTDYTRSAQSGIDRLDVLADAFAVEYLKPQFAGAATDVRR